MPRHQLSLEGFQESATDILLGVINHAKRIFAGRQNWLSPLTSDEQRKEFISRCCWWNRAVYRAMERVGAV